MSPLNQSITKWNPNIELMISGDKSIINRPLLGSKENLNKQL